MFYGASSGFLCSLQCVSGPLCSVDRVYRRLYEFFGGRLVSPLGINKVFSSKSAFDTGTSNKGVQTGQESTP